MAIEEIVKSIGVLTTKYWVNLFSNLPRHELGVIKVSGKLLNPVNLPNFSAEIAYLANELGIYMPIVCGGGVFYDTKSTKKVNGLRITSKEDIETISRKAFDVLESLQHNLKSHGVSTEIVSPDTLKVVPHGLEPGPDGPVNMGYVGDIVSVNTRGIIDAVHNGRVPIMTHLGIYEKHLHNVNATTVATELVKHLQARKLVVVGDKPVQDSDGKIIKKIYSHAFLKKLISNNIITDGMAKNCMDSYELLTYLGPGHCVQITSFKSTKDSIVSSGLLEEIVGNGSGTMLMMLPVITQYPLSAVSVKAVRELINQSFLQNKKRLATDYFENLPPCATVYLDRAHKGGGISYPLHKAEYICKLFTKEEYEGIGIATSVLESATLNYESIVMRADRKNDKATKFYSEYVKCRGGFFSYDEDYTYFGINVARAEQDELCKQMKEIGRTMEEAK